jgi:hypothetical protein
MQGVKEAEIVALPVNVLVLNSFLMWDCSYFHCMLEFI